MGAPTSPDGEPGPPEPRDGPEPDWDARWHELTESLGELAAPGAPVPSSRVESAPAAGSEHEDPDGGDVALSSAAASAGERATLGGPRDYAPPDEDEGFVPADPGPITGDPLTTVAWCALAGAPLVLVLSLILWRDAPGLVIAACIAAFVAGAGILLWRMPARRSDDGDDGAVV